MNLEINIQAQFEELLCSKFPDLKPIHKWKQIMWHKEGKLVVSLIFLSKKIKFCFFNNPDLELDKLQRWSSSIYSQNLEINNGDKINWKRVENLIANTLQSRSN